MTKFFHALAVAAAFGISGHANADDAAKASASVMHKLKDGGTLYVFADGKMAKESKYGVAVYLKKGEVLEAADGKVIIANSNEVARLGNLLSEGHAN